MLNTVDQYLVRTYLVDLRRELAIQGLGRKRIEAVLEETYSHLQEAMAAAEPSTDLAAERVIEQFGRAPAMAKALAAQEDRSNAKRRFLWPALYFLAAFLTFTLTPYMMFRFFHDRIWFGTLFLLISAGVLGALGFLARRPVFSQFAAVAGLLVIGQTGWYSTTSIPVERYGWYQPVKRADSGRFIDDIQAQIARGNQVIDKVKRGQAVFMASNVAKITPGEFVFRGNYMTPEAVRELTIGIDPDVIQPALFARTWRDAVKAWNEVTPGRGWSGAEEVLRMQPDSIIADQRALANFEWMREQPLIVQLGVDLKMTLLPTSAMGTMALLATNAGWFLWLMLRGLGRVRRRLLYASDPLYAVALPEA